MMAFFTDARWDYSLVADMSKAFLYLRKSYSLISRLSSLLPWIILRSSVMNALRYSSNSLKSSSSSSNGHRELSTGLFKSEQFNQEGLTPGSRARSIVLPDGQFGETTRKGWMKQPCGYTNISDAIRIAILSRRSTVDAAVQLLSAVLGSAE